jgi:hypothetical protein
MNMKKVFFLDNDFLSRLWSIDGRSLPDQLANMVQRSGFCLEVTDVVLAEIQRGPHGADIRAWMKSRSVIITNTAEYAPYMQFQELQASGLLPKNAKYRSAKFGIVGGGDASIVERMLAERRAGSQIMVGSDDKFFRVPPTMKGPSIRGFGFDSHLIVSSLPDFINQLRVRGTLTAEQIRKVNQLDIFNPVHKNNSYSPELSRMLLSDAEVIKIQKEGGAATVTLMSKFGKGLKFLGIAGLIYDIGTSSAEAAEAARNGNPARAGEVMAKLVARTYGGLKLGMLVGGAAAVLLAGTPFVLTGVLLGGIAGGIAGAVVGDMLAERIWGAARKAIGMLSQPHPDNKVGAFAMVEQDLAARKVPGDIARKVAVALNDGSLADAHVKTALREHIYRLDKAIAANAEAPVVGEIVVRHIDLGYNGDRSRTTVVDGDRETTVNQNGKLLEERSYGPKGLMRVKSIDEWTGDASARYVEYEYGVNGKITKQTSVEPYGRAEYYYDPSPGTRVREMHFDQHDVLVQSRMVRVRDEAEERRFEAELIARRKREQRLQAERLAEMRRVAEENRRRERIKAQELAAMARREEALQAENGYTGSEYVDYGYGSLDHSRVQPPAPVPASIPVVTLPPVIIKEEIDPSGDVSDYFESSDVHDQIQDGWEAAQSQLDCYYDSSLSCGGTPVVLDLDRSGTFDIRLYANQPQPTTVVGKRAFQAPKFDFDGDGIPDRTAWVGPNDGFLVIDRGAGLAPGADGLINQPQELAFTQWKTPQAWQAELDTQPAGGGIDRITDLSALRLLFDSNRDGVLDRNDEQWRGFRVWQDLNQDGVAGAGELRTLDQAGITAIGLVPDTSRAVRYADGSMITGTSYAQLDDGSQMRVGDAALRFESSAAARQKQDGMSGATGGCGVNCKLDNLVAAMAGFAPPAAGRLSLPPGLQQLPPGVIAAN